MSVSESKKYSFHINCYLSDAEKFEYEAFKHPPLERRLTAAAQSLRQAAEDLKEIVRYLAK